MSAPPKKPKSPEKKGNDSTVFEDRLREREIDSEVDKLKFRLSNLIVNYNSMSKAQILLDLEREFPRVTLANLSIHKLRVLIAETIIPALNQNRIPKFKV